MWERQASLSRERAAGATKAVRVRGTVLGILSQGRLEISSAIENADDLHSVLVNGEGHHNPLPKIGDPQTAAVYRPAAFRDAETCANSRSSR